MSLDLSDFSGLRTTRISGAPHYPRRPISGLQSRFQPRGDQRGQDRKS